MRSPEGHEKAEIRKYLNAIGAWHFVAAMGMFGAAGIPDIIACINGRFVGIEVKREGKDPTKRQDARMKEIVEAGGLAFWGTAEKVIREIMYWLRTPGSRA